MVYDITNNGKCVRAINEFWRKLGVEAGARIEGGRIISRLTDGLHPTRVVQSKLNAAVANSGALRT